MAHLKHITIRILLLLIFSLLSLVLLEYGIRTLLPQFSPTGQLRFIQQGYTNLAIPRFQGRQWKNTGDYNVSIAISPQGFREPRPLYHSNANDIFVVGDSFTFGHGVERQQRFSNLLEQALNRHVYNISAPNDFDGYHGLINHARKHGATIQNLIIAVCMENDLRHYSSSLPEQYPDTPLDFSLKNIKRWLAEHSAIYVATSHLIHQSNMTGHLAKQLQLIEDIKPVDSSIEDKTLIKSSVKRLLRLARQSKTAQQLVVIIPSRALWIGNHQPRANSLHHGVVSAMRNHGLEVVDLRRPFEASGDPMQYHFKNDGHWNPEGHALAGKVITEYIQQHGIFQ